MNRPRTIKFIVVVSVAPNEHVSNAGLQCVKIEHTETIELAETLFTVFSDAIPKTFTTGDMLGFDVTLYEYDQATHLRLMKTVRILPPPLHSTVTFS